MLNEHLLILKLGGSDVSSGGVKQGRSG